MQAVILAGGLGTRLRPFTYEIPKPMVPINGKPYLEYQLEYLRKQDIKNILILVGYLGEQISSYFGDGKKFGLDIQYSTESVPMGTGGGLKNAESLLEEDFLLIYGDSFLPLEYGDVIKKYNQCRSKALLCVYNNQEDTNVISNIALEEETHKILAYRKDVQDITLKYVDAGVLIVNKEVLKYIPYQQVISLEQYIFPILIKEGTLFAYPSNHRFYDIGTPERLKLAMEVLV